MSKQKPPYKALRYFIVSLVLLALLACILPFFLKGPGNQRLVSTDQIKLPEINFLNKQPQDTRSVPTSPKSTPRIKEHKIYKWEDKDGVLHFTDYPNPNGPSQLMMATPDTRAKNKSDSPTHSPSDHEGIISNDNPLSFIRPMTLSPSQINKLKQDAQEIRQDLENRTNELDKMLQE